MIEVKSDEQRCDTCTTPAEASMDEMADEKENETSTNSSTVNFAGVDKQANGIVQETMEKIPSTFDFAERSWKTDFTLIVEETRFYVAKNILALASPVFDRMFESDFKESTTDELELPGKGIDEVKEFLLAIYPNTASVMSREVALKVLPLAEEYQVLNLKRRCEEALMGSINTLTSVDELYLLIKEGHLYNLKELLKRCISFVCQKPTEEVERANREIVLPGEPLSDILQNLNDRLVSRTKELESSNTLMAKQLETYKTWNNFFSKALKKSDYPKFDEDLVWEGRTRRFKFDLKKLKPVEDYIIIWNTKFNITFDSGNNWIRAQIKNQCKDMVTCDFTMQSVIVNKMPTEEHISVNHKAKFYSEQQSTTCNVAAVSSVADPKKGFAYEGKVQLEVNIFMSEPKKI